MHTGYLVGQARRRRRPAIRWPWVVVAAAWGVAVLTNQSYLVDHHQLLGGHYMWMAGH